MTTPQEFVNDHDTAVKNIMKIQQSNLAKIKALSASGKGLDPAAFANLKLDVFVETFLDPNAQLVYTFNVENKLQETLDEALKEVRQEMLTQGVKNSKLIMPR